MLELVYGKVRITQGLGPLPLFLRPPAPIGIFTPFSALTSSSSGKPAHSALLLPAEIIADFPYSLRPLCLSLCLSCGPCGVAHCAGVSSLQGHSLTFQTCSDQADSKDLRDSRSDCWPGCVPLGT